MKKMLIAALTGVIALQLAVPAFFVLQKYDTLKNGAEYNFEVELYDPYDAFRGRYVAIYPKAQMRLYNTMKVDRGIYGTLGVDEDGFAFISWVSNTKPDKEYIKSKSSLYYELPIDRYYTDEDLAPAIEKLLTPGLIIEVSPNYRPYVTVRVKNGMAVIQGMYIDGVRIEDFVPVD